MENNEIIDDKLPVQEGSGVLTREEQKKLMGSAKELLEDIAEEDPSDLPK